MRNQDSDFKIQKIATNQSGYFLKPWVEEYNLALLPYRLSASEINKVIKFIAMCIHIPTKVLNSYNIKPS